MKHRLLQYSSIAAALIFVAVFFGLAIYNTPGSNAVKATDFQAGRIIDDEIFYNKDTMTVAEIQAFLDSHTPTCDVWGEKTLGAARYHSWGTAPASMKRADYAKWRREVGGDSRYHDPPYVCVNLYYENPTTHETNFDTNFEVKEGMLSAAEIIYQAAQKYNINPQVLLVMLKKESYAWGDDWPIKWGYNTIMGYGCPDTAPCNEKYYGFYNQIMMAAWQLNYYKDHIYSYGYIPFASNNIYYSPDYSCGTKSVYLENIATTSLYIYTPYTPNDAALRNYPGTATCGSYGNRNFFMYFNEWFGTTLISNVTTTNTENLPTDSLRIVTTDGEKSIQLKTLSKESTTKFTVGDIENGDLDTFTISKYSDGSYMIKNDYSGLVLDVPSNNVYSGASVQQYTSNNTNAQKWLIYQHDDGTYSIVSVSNKSFALSYHDNGLILERYVGADYQKFSLKIKVALGNGTQVDPDPDPDPEPNPNTDPEEPKVGVIEDGNYVVYSNVKANYLLDAANTTGQGDINALMHNKGSIVAEAFKFVYSSDSDTYKIQNIATQKYLSSTSANDVVLSTATDLCNQKWKISKNADGTYTFENTCDGKVLDIYCAYTDNGTNVRLYSGNGTNAQKWKFEKYVEQVTTTTPKQLIANGAYDIRSKLKNNYSLDASGNSKTSGANVQAWTANNTTAQQWTFTYNEAGDYYTIIGKGSNKALDVKSAGTSDGTNVHIWDSNNTCAQHWRATQNSDGSYTFLNVCSNKALDVRSAGTSDGTNVHIWAPNNTTAQKWILIKK